MGVNVATHTRHVFLGSAPGLFSASLSEPPFSAYILTDELNGK